MHRYKNLDVNKSSISNRTKCANFCMVGCLVLYTYGQALQNTTGIDSFIFTLPILGLLFMIFFCLRDFYILKMKYSVALFVGICLSICILQILNSEMTLDSFKYIAFFVSCIMMSQVSEKSTFTCFKYSIITLSILLSLDALWHLPQLLASGTGLYNIRIYTLVDKPWYSFILSFSVIILLIEVTYNKINKIFATILIIVNLAINIIVVQSKATILCIGVALFLVLVNSSAKNRKRILLGLILLSILAILIVHFYPEKIPAYIGAAIYQIFGINIGDYGDQYNRLNYTFDARNNIYDYVWGIFEEHPLLGIGFGNYTVLGSNYTGITDTESSLLQSFVGGGAVFALSYILLCITISLNLFKLCKNKHYQCKDVELLVLFVIYFILNIQNDYFSLIYFLFMGMTISRVSRMEAWSR